MCRRSTRSALPQPPETSCTGDPSRSRWMPSVTTTSPGHHAGAYLGETGTARTDLDLALDGAAILHQEHVLPALARAERLLGHHQHLVAGPLERDREEHAGLEQPVGVRDLRDHHHGPRHRVDTGVDTDHLAAERMRRVGGALRGDRHARLELGQKILRHVEFEADGPRVVERGDRRLRSDEIAEADTAQPDGARERRPDGRMVEPGAR